MNKEEKFLGVIIAVSVVLFLVYGINLYFQTSNEIVQSIEIEDVPVGANKVGDIKTANVSYNEVDYGKNVSFLSVRVFDKKFFKIKKLDQINFSVENKRSGTIIYRDTVIVSIRGIAKAELPIVYDYTAELSLRFKGIDKPWYTDSGFTWNVNDQYPWILSVKNVKRPLTDSVIISILAGVIIGFIIGFILIALSRTLRYIWKFAKLKFSKKTKTKPIDT